MNEQLAIRLTIASHDLMQAGKFVMELASLRRQSNPNPVVVSALVIAAITAYGRPFTASFSDGKAARKVDPEALNVFAEHPDLKPVHEQLLDLRNRAAAHADWEYHQTTNQGTDRLILTHAFESDLMDTDAVLKLIALMGVSVITEQYWLDGKPYPWKQT